MGHQRKGASLFLKHKSVAFFWEPGTGKTLGVLAAIVRLASKGSIKRILVAGPKTARTVWSRQLIEHVRIDRIPIYALIDPSASQINAIKNDDITLISVSHRRLSAILDTFGDDYFDMIVIDESQRIKKHNTQQSKVAYELGKYAEYKCILSGTPLDKSELDLWAQYRFLDDSIFGHNWFKFIKRYCHQIDIGHTRIPKLKNAYKKWIIDQVKHITMAVKRRDVLDLPPVVDGIIDFELRGKAKKAYKQMEEEFLIEFGDHTSTSEMTVTAMLRLQQLTGGFFKTDDDDTIQLEQDKLNAFLDHFEDMPDQKVVIFAQYTAEIDILHEAILRFTTVEILDGRTKDRTIWETFQDEHDPRVIIVQTQMGVGIDLFKASLAYFYSGSFSYIDYRQCRDRLDRKGQLNKILFIHLLAQFTIDMHRYNVLKIKGDLADHVFNQLKKGKTMAKKEKAAKGEKKAKGKSNLPEFVKPKYGIPELAEELGVEPSVCRQKLRAGGYEKEGRAWDFGSAKEMKNTAKDLASKTKKKKKDEDDD